MANRIAEEWLRLRAFEEDGVIKPKGRISSHYYEKIGEGKFSASELAECWARYWDVHTRSPAQIIREEEEVDAS